MVDVREAFRSDHIDQDVIEFLAEQEKKQLEAVDAPVPAPDSVEDFIENYACNSHFTEALTLQRFKQYLNED